MWSAAIAWVSKNSNFRFQTQGDHVVSTYCPDQTPDSCYELNRESYGAGKGRINRRVYCNNPFICGNALADIANLADAIVAARARHRQITGYVPPPVPAAVVAQQRYHALVRELDVNDSRFSTLTECGTEAGRDGKLEPAEVLACYDQRTGASPPAPPAVAAEAPAPAPASVPAIDAAFLDALGAELPEGDTRRAVLGACRKRWTADGALDAAKAFACFRAATESGVPASRPE